MFLYCLLNDKGIAAYEGFARSKAPLTSQEQILTELVLIRSKHRSNRPITRRSSPPLHTGLRVQCHLRATYQSFMCPIRTIHLAVDRQYV